MSQRQQPHLTVYRVSSTQEAMPMTAALDYPGMKAYYDMHAMMIMAYDTFFS